jgi:iron complex transport system substrate-binding protein
MKIVSLLPSATEIVYALGLGDQLAAITHECDFPTEVSSKPIITRSVLPPGMNSADIDEAVRGQLSDSHSLYTIDRELLAEINPDVILTQQLCDVCAVSYNDVLEAVRSLPSPGPRVLNLEPITVADVLGTIRQVGLITGREEEAETVISGLTERIVQVKSAVAGAAHRPRTVLLEWIDPLFGGGHWDPELVDLAGGIDTIGSLHQPSTQVSWNDIRRFGPEVLIIAQCGFSVERSLQDMPSLEALPGYAKLPAVRDGRVFIINGSDYFSRPGPRLVDSLEILAALLHPDRVELNETFRRSVVQWPPRPR